MISLLKNVPIFAGLTEEALKLLLQQAVEQEFPAGSVIVKEGEASNLLFLIGEGKVRVVKNFERAGEVELAVLEARDFFGEMCIIDTMPRVATVQAVGPTRLFSISSMAFHRLYCQMPAQHSILILNIARDLARRLRHLDETFAAR